MLVEDDNNLREIYGARLMAEGYEIVSAADGEEALALAVKEKPDLIISDVMMPKISGFDMLDILRTTPETKNTKVIMMTALSQPEDRARGESLGADRYLVKSQVTLEDVVVAVHDILGDGAGQTMSQDQAAQAPAPAPADPPAAPAPAPEPPAAPVEPPADENSPPKAEGASDAPEPAGKKKKIIQPINDLAQDTQHLQNLVAVEEANERQAEIIQAQFVAAKELADEVTQTPSEPTDVPLPTPAEPTPAAPAPATTVDADDAKLAQEKAELNAEIAQLADSGVIEREAAQAPAAQAVSASLPVEKPVTEADAKPTQMSDEEKAAEAVLQAAKSAPAEQEPAPTEAEAPKTETTEPAEPAAQAPEPAAEPTPPAPPKPAEGEPFDPNDIAI